jgi:hypothetical protein
MSVEALPAETPTEAPLNGAGTPIPETEPAPPPANDDGLVDEVPPEPWFVGKDGKPFGPKPEDKKSDEAKKAEPKEEKTPQEKIDRAFVSLHKQRRAFEKMAAKRAAEFEAKESALKLQDKELGELRELYAKDKHAFAARLGLSFRELAENALKGEETPEAKELRELREWKAEVQAEREAKKAAEEEAKRTESMSASRTEALAALSEEATALVATHPILGAYETSQVASWAFDRLLAHWKATADPNGMDGEELDHGEVFATIAKELEESYERLARVKKPVDPNGSSARGNGAVEPAKPEANSAPATLSNRIAAQRASTDRPLTRDERAAKAAALLKFRS